MKLQQIFRNETENRLRAGWRMLGQQLLLVFILMLLEDYATTPIKFWLSPAALLVLDAIAGMLAFGISVWLAGKWLDHRRFVDFGFHVSPLWWGQFGFGALLGAFLMIFIFLVEWAFGYVDILQIGFTVDPTLSLALALLVMFIHYIGISFTEELLARGYLLRNLLEGFSTPYRNLTIGSVVFVSSIIFALPHTGNPNATLTSTLLLIVFGIMCATGVILTGELAIPLGLHLTWNFFQGNVFGFPVSGWEMRGGTILYIQQSGPEWFTGGAFGPEAGMIGLLAMGVGIALIVLWSRGYLQSKEAYLKQKQLTA